MAWRFIQKAAEIGYAKVKAEGAKTRQRIVEGVKENPKVVAVGGAVVAGAATGGLSMVPVLGAIGFSSIGPVAGSMAAGIQSAGAAGAVFSACQSAAMGGYGVAAVLSSFIGAGATVAGGAAAATVGTSSNNPRREGENQSQESKAAHDKDEHDASGSEEEE